MRQGSGLADWATFAHAVRRAVQPDLQSGRVFPGRRRMADLGYQNLVSAAYHHHGGWSTIRRRLGHTYHPPTRVMKPTTNYGRYARYRAVRFQALTSSFPSWLAWQVLPPASLAAKVRPGLLAYYQRQFHTWHAAGYEFDLLTGLPARRSRRYCLATVEALSFTLKHGRWPNSTECGSWLKHWRYGRRWTWGDCLSSLRVPPPMLDKLRDYWHRHYRSIQRLQPHLEAEHLRVMNRFVVGNNHVLPTTNT